MARIKELVSQASVNGPPLQTLAAKVPAWMSELITAKCKSLSIDRSKFITLALQDAIENAGWGAATE